MLSSYVTLYPLTAGKVETKKGQVNLSLHDSVGAVSVPHFHTVNQLEMDLWTNKDPEISTCSHS